MAFYFYRKYYFSNAVKTKWEAMTIVKDAETNAKLKDFFDGEWIKVVDDSGWGKVIKKQLLGE